MKDKLTPDIRINSLTSIRAQFGDDLNEDLNVQQYQSTSLSSFYYLSPYQSIHHTSLANLNEICSHDKEFENTYTRSHEQLNFDYQDIQKYEKESTQQHLLQPMIQVKPLKAIKLSQSTNDLPSIKITNTSNNTNQTTMVTFKQNEIKKMLNVNKKPIHKSNQNLNNNNNNSNNNGKLRSRRPPSAQPHRAHYCRKVIDSTIDITSTRIDPKKEEKAARLLRNKAYNSESFKNVYKILVRVKPRKLTVDEIRTLNVSEKFVSEASKMIFYPELLAFSPRIFKQ